LWQLMPAFPDLDALNAWLEERCIALWQETEHGGLPSTIADVFAAERAAFPPAPEARRPRCDTRANAPRTAERRVHETPASTASC
jgi:hypothetical protein